MKEDLQVYENILQLIGNTPLIKLNKITQNFPGKYYAKVEAALPEPQRPRWQKRNGDSND